MRYVNKWIATVRAPKAEGQFAEEANSFAIIRESWRFDVELHNVVLRLVEALLKTEAVDEDLIPFVKPILWTYRDAYAKYQGASLLILYDAIGTLFETLGSAMNQPEYVAIIVPPLVERLDALADDDICIIPLLETLASLTTSLGSGFFEYGPSVFRRCLRLVEPRLLDVRASSFLFMIRYSCFVN